MKISEVAKKTGLAASNIRFYEKKNLLTPSREQQNQYRDYSAEDVERLKKIMVLRKAGLSLEVIHSILYEDAEIKTLLSEQQIKLQGQIQELQGALDLCRALEKDSDPLNMCADDYLNYICEEEGRGKCFAEIHDTIDELAEFVESMSISNMLYPILGKYSYLAKFLQLLFWVLFGGMIIYSIITKTVNPLFALYWGLLFLWTTIKFIRYHRRLKTNGLI